MPEADKNTTRCDLHIHSSFSDGRLSPEEIVAQARVKGIGCISITDHDSIEAFKYLKGRLLPASLELIPGIELTAFYKEAEIHILGYFIDSQNSQLIQELREAYLLRQARFKEMAGRLIRQGLSLDKERLFAQVSGIVPTRLHLAQYLLKTKQVNSLSQAFRMYLGQGKPAYICASGLSPGRAISLIHNCGGISFLAHPHQLVDSAWIDEFTGKGLDGLEVIHPGMPKNQSFFYSGYADRHGLLKSGGSDFHGSFSRFRAIGNGTIPYLWVEKMKQRKKDIVRDERSRV